MYTYLFVIGSYKYRIRVSVSDFTWIYVSYVCMCAICFDAVRDLLASATPENRYMRGNSSIIGSCQKEQSSRSISHDVVNYLLRSPDLARGERI